MRTKLLILSVISLLLSIPTFSQSSKNTERERGGRAVRGAAVLWREPYDIHKRNLFYGPGGRARQPLGRFRFIEEDKGGTSPKFEVVDGRGVRWKVKLGDEAQSETAATRLLWAAGYFTDEIYYMPQVRIERLPRLRRGQEYVSANGVVCGARFERVNKGIKKVGNWSWHDNPFLGTKEFNGLRVLMALTNNWDLKKDNNGIYNIGGRESRYLVTDLGATFGKTGGNWTRSKNDVEDYVRSDFIEEIEPTTVDLVLRNRPPLLYAVAVPYFYERTRMETIGEDIPRAHARWIGQLLARLSSGQIADAFRAAGYAPREVNAFTNKVRQRIHQLNRL